MPELSDYELNKKMTQLQKKLQIASKNRVLRYDLMVISYFNDMYRVLKEAHRVLKKHGSASIVVGDSSLYGIYVPTDKILADIGKSLGFNAKIEHIRNRKATRHSHRLVESNVCLIKN